MKWIFFGGAVLCCFFSDAGIPDGGPEVTRRLLGAIVFAVLALFWQQEEQKP